METAYNAERIFSEVQALGIDAVIIHFSNLYSNQETVAQIRIFIDLSIRAGINISIIAPVPGNKAHVPKAMYESLQANKDPDIAITGVEYLDNTKDFRNFINALNAYGIHVLYPAKILCGEKKQKCIYADTEYKPYYFDSSHLTLTGAAKLDTLFEESMKKVDFKN